MDQFVLERPRIHQLLTNALESRLLIVSAGEGCGKTCAVNAFLRGRSESTIWLQLSERDNHPQRFWENYCQALGLCRSEAGNEMREVGFPETARQVGRWYEIGKREFSSPGKYVIVGDDFHRVKSKAVLEFIERALRYPILNHVLILICRGEPELNVIPLMSKGRLTRIGPEDLLFNQEEIAAYFRLRNMELQADEAGEIYRDTEGWPLALGFVADEMQKSGGRYIQIVSQNGVRKFIEKDLFAAVPKDFQKYLIKLSLLEHWSLDLLEKTAAMLPEKYRALPPVLAELEKLGALVRYDYYLREYRFHQFFLDFLREKRHEIPRDEVKAICTIAGRWCQENNLQMDAAINFERAGDYAALAAIVDTFPRIVPRAAAGPLLDIINRMANREDRNEADEQFIYLRWAVRGRLLMCLSRFEEAAAAFQESIGRFEAAPPSPAASRVLAEAWDALGLICLVLRRIKTGSPDFNRPETSNEYCISCFEKSDFYYRRHPWQPTGAMAICSVSSYVIQIGCPAAAGEFAQRVNSCVEGMARAGSSLNGYLSGLDDLALTELAFYQGDLNTAERYALKSVIRAREKSQFEIEHRGLFFLLRINLCRGNLEGFLEARKQHEALRGAAGYVERDSIGDIIDGWLSAHLGEPDKTAPWLRGWLEASDLFSMFRNYDCMVHAKYLYAAKQYAEAASFLNLEEHRSGLKSFLLGVMEMNCLEAAARFKLGDEAAALVLFEKTCEAAALNSLCMPFIELGNDMRGLANAALAAGTAVPRPWLQDIRSRSSAYGKNLFSLAEQLRGKESKSASIYLTRQEREVLRGLSQGQTREEIAAATGQSLSAVKTVIARMCEKLGAVNRAGAVRIASGLGLLGSPDFFVGRH